MREQRLVFGEVAGDYDRTRPRYPPEAIRHVTDAAAPAGRPTVVEVGAGTGIATRALLAAGCRVTALEPDPAMATVLVEQVGPGAVTVVSSSFEDWDPVGGPFDLCVAFQAWHWVDPTRRYGLAHAALRPGGRLALVWNVPARLPGPLGPELDAVYARHAPDLVERSPGSGFTARHDDIEGDIEASGLFAAVEAHSWPNPVRYTTADYVTVLATQSNHRLLPPATLAALLADIAAAVDGRGGTLDVPQTTWVFTARSRHDEAAHARPASA